MARCYLNYRRRLWFGPGALAGLRAVTLAVRVAFAAVWPLGGLVEVAQTMIPAIYRRLWHDTGVYSGTVHWQDRDVGLRMLSESHLLCGHLVAL